MKHNMPPDIYDWLANAASRPVQVREVTNPFLRRPGESDEAFLARMATLRIFQPNPLAELDPRRQWVPMHRWTTPDGYSLSDNIWRAGNDVRQRIDALVARGIRNGHSALSIASAVEAYLLPNEIGRRTLRPYGSHYQPGGASYSAMRLARTEIAAAGNRAAFTAAYLNPYVGGINVARSANGDPTCPVCPQHATIDMNGVRVRPPYPLTSAHIPPYHPHDMCHVRPVMVDNLRAVSDRLRAVMVDTRAEVLRPVTTPVQPGRLLMELIGQTLLRVAGQELGIRVGQVPLPLN